jgi:hypothetical protein
MPIDVIAVEDRELSAAEIIGVSVAQPPDHMARSVEYWFH